MSFDFDAAVGTPFRMQPGLRRLASGVPQLTPASPGGRHLQEKLAVFGAQPGRALLAAPGFNATAALAALAAHAAAEHPQALERHDDGLAVPRLGWSVRGERVVDEGGDAAIGAVLRALAPIWRAAALLALAFEEDFAVLDAASGTIAWMAVALPSSWAPEDKIGRSFAEVHAPVADNRLVVGASEHLVRLVTGAERWERFVWTISRHPALDAHPARPSAPWPADADDDTVAARAHWRTERQTFIPLPAERQAVFTIHVQVQPLAEAMTPPRARRVHDALASMSDAVLAYRGLVPVREPLLRWLARRAAA